MRIQMSLFLFPHSRRPRRDPRFAAGRARALGVATRGTTNPNRLRRNDNWICSWPATSSVLANGQPLVIDLGYGATPITTLELASRIHRHFPAAQILGLEIDPERVERALPSARPPMVDFARGGFELAGRRPQLVRAMNVLRQYDEQPAYAAWDEIVGRLAPGGVLVEGTCDEIGRVGTWVLIDAVGPRSLTFSCSAEHLDRPETLAERLPKVLIHHNVPGEKIFALISALGAAWDAAAGLSVFSNRQRWAAAAASLAEQGWPVLDGPKRWRQGELTVDWSAVS